MLQAAPAKTALATRTDRYYRGFDQNVPDQFRIDEWEREFSGYVAHGNLPALEMMTVPHDHFGDFKTALDGLGTPELQFADNDYALGKVIDAVAHSPYAASTLIFVVEDSAQDGPDHVDAHRSLAFVIGPYVKHHAVIATPYSTVNVLRTIEDILGIDHLSIHDALQPPMTDLFDPKQPACTYHAQVPAALGVIALPDSP